MMGKLSMDDLEKATGGFNEQNKVLPTFGMNIVCPKCKSTYVDSFSSGALYDPKLKTVEYQCKCGCQFVCQNGQAYEKSDFLALCKKKGIHYAF